MYPSYTTIYQNMPSYDGICEYMSGYRGVRITDALAKDLITRQFLQSISENSLFVQFSRKVRLVKSLFVYPINQIDSCSIVALLTLDTAGRECIRFYSTIINSVRECVTLFNV